MRVGSVLSRFRVECVILAIMTAGCGGSAGPATHSRAPVTLTMGVSSTKGASQNALVGLQQVADNIALELLVNWGRDGRPRPGLASKWVTSPNHQSLKIELRPDVKFHDGSPVNADAVAEVLRASLPDALGPSFEDIENVRPVGDREIEVVLRRPSAFALEALVDLSIKKPGEKKGIGTGPFYAWTSEPDTVEMRANESYYLGRPKIDRLVLKSYPTARNAWADMLRGQLDMLSEVGFDALDSLKPSSNVRVFTFPRNYQYLVVLNSHVAALRSRDVRVALNEAIDRAQIIEQGLGGHGAPATGTVSPLNWAYDTNGSSFALDPKRSQGTLEAAAHGHSVTFKCLAPDTAPYDRIAVALQRQLSVVGAKMEIEGVPAADWVKRVLAGDFEAALVDARIGTNLVRPYQWWHTGTTQNYGHFSSTAIDRSLDAIRHATSDDEYRASVAALQRAVVDDPPAIFLAWSDRARAVSTRFEVPDEAGRDILSTLRLWKPVADERHASRN